VPCLYRRLHLTPCSLQATPIVQVALLPKSVSDLPLLVEGLRLLNQADAFVEVTVQTNGEHVLGAAGEVHLERCIKDLEERFAGVLLNVRPSRRRETHIHIFVPSPHRTGQFLHHELRLFGW